MERVTPAAVPLLSQNDANCRLLARSGKASLSSLMILLPGTKSVTDMVSEKVMSSNAFNICARAAPRCGVPINTIPIVFLLIWLYISLLCATINA